MGSESWRKLPSVIQDLVNWGSHYHFFQAMRLLEELWLNHDGLSRHLNQGLKLLPNNAISFPAADISHAKRCEDDEIAMYLNFMGLYGVDSPLPHYFLDHTLRDDDNSATIRRFLAVFNHRIYSLLYSAWKKFHPFVQLQHKDNQYMHYLAALSGHALVADDANEFAFVGLLGARVHNTAALAGMLQDYLQGISVQIDQFQPHWVQLDQQSSFAADQIHQLCLGDNTVLGAQVLDVTSKIVIKIGPLTTPQAMKLLPGQEQAFRLGRLIERYLDVVHTFELILLVEATEPQCLQLGSQQIALGWTCWVGYLLQSTYQLCVSGGRMTRWVPRSILRN